VTIGDDVRAQHRLVTEHFGIKHLELVLGWSMGAEQTYEWAVRFPDMVKRALPFAGTAKTTPHDYIFVRSHRCRTSLEHGIVRAPCRLEHTPEPKSRRRRLRAGDPIGPGPNAGHPYWAFS
jgi:pimeloyl-ACP methyl ester carboxylesterase